MVPALPGSPFSPRGPSLPSRPSRPGKPPSGGATHNQGTGVGHCFLGIDHYFCSQGSPGLCEQEQHGEREEKHVLGRGKERGGALGPRTRLRAGPAPGGQEKPFPHLLSHPLGPRVPSSKSSLGKVRIRSGQGGHVWTSWASDLVCQQHEPTLRWSGSSLLGLVIPVRGTLARM